MDHLCFLVSCVFNAFASVHCCLVVTCWERAALLALVGDVYCYFVTFLCGILDQVWYFIVSFPDLCLLSYVPLVRVRAKMRNTLYGLPMARVRTKIEKNNLCGRPLVRIRARIEKKNCGRPLVLV